jgi:hypothetical protein
MAQKRGKKQHNSPEKLRPVLAEAVFALASDKGWEAASLQAAARKLGIGQDAAASAFGDLGDVIAWQLRALADESGRNIREYMGDNWRDNLMEAMMMRFEVALPHRRAYAALPAFAARHPAWSPRLAKTFLRGIRDMIALAGMPAGLSLLHAPAIAAIYLSIIPVWADDDAAGMPRTMAAIDMRIGWLEKIDAFLPKNRRAG